MRTDKQDSAARAYSTVFGQANWQFFPPYRLIAAGQSVSLEHKAERRTTKLHCFPSPSLRRLRVAPHLPDEILSEILSTALNVDDDLFTQSLAAAPFVRFSEPPSAYLLVCKAWLRVATPLLYNVVVIRSKAQAQALSAVLCHNPPLRAFIRKLRVEGGYGASMYKVLANALNLTDLFLGFDTYSTEKTDGLCKGLACVNPRRLILDTDGYKANNPTQRLADALVAAIPRWYRLGCLDVSATNYLGPSRPFISRVLAATTTLTHVVVGGVVEGEYVCDESKHCPLRLLELKSTTEWIQWDANFLSSRIGSMEAKIKADKRPLKLDIRSCFQETPHTSVRTQLTPPSESESDPFFRPMAAAPLDVQTRIWSHILSFVLSDRDRAWHWMWTSAERDPHNLLLVSKMFHAAAVEGLYQEIELKSLVSWVLLARTLEAKPRYARYIRSVSLSDSRQDVSAEGNSLLLDAFIMTVLPALNHLTFKCNLYCHLFFLMYAHRLITLRVAVSSLRTMQPLLSSSENSESPESPPRVLDLCPNLRSLTIDTDSRFTGGTLALFDAQYAHRSLRTLVFIIESLDRDHAWAAFFAGLAARIIPRCLPTLQEVVLNANFQWPITERDINRCAWVDIADGLIAAGVRVADRNGTRWRTRLKVQSRKCHTTSKFTSETEQNRRGGATRVLN
ncbi:F-box domain-containing protein [Mycena indigotica]|uniref:F-box domain-containing protein n=1 Tax=Mycena indigotica TaxID=2126181 RepID=A0A8H6S478_9AGAR|nr:F-box domain-containing protein [Mycena indigotica]KAF7292028.1 F-box domain-containing protein [Mycena indigotica]